MIVKERMEELQKIGTAINMILDITHKNKVLLESEWSVLINDNIIKLFPDNKLTNEEKTFICRWVMQSLSIAFSRVDGLVLDNNRKWFSTGERDNKFFERYSRFLMKSKHFSTRAVTKLSKEVLNPIMDQLGNPKSNEGFERHGLVVGDVQSGKTLTYIGLINKAADAGYKVIVVLTGTIETLRKQTQERIDEGFTGIDSDSTQKDQKLIGVGLDSASKKGRYAASFTTKKLDFTVAQANGVGVSMDNLSSPVIIVAKKNVKVLERIYEWLRGNNPSKDGKMDYPLLLIDDEADNASINTKDEDSDPTKTNARIRTLLNLFSKYTYIGFTATPFANIFINPDLYDEKLGNDLFPRDFIFNLTPNDQYIGGKDIFLENSKFKNSLIKNDDCEKELPASHKKNHSFKNLPNTLKESLILFAISNVIRDLRGDDTAHRSMLINISRFIVMHDVIYYAVKDYNDKIMDSYFNYCKTSFSDENLKLTEDLFNREYSNCGYIWLDIKPRLYDSNKDVIIKSINSENDMLNYKDYEGIGARCIFIGGMSLSRGLTLEGLCISYFYRYSKTYDVLFQMGRWFGYRPRYEDLFRIYMPTELIGWYETVTESIETLRMDLIKMQKAGKKPSDFGIRVMNDSTVLKITNASKMRTSQTAYDTVLGFGEIIPTPDIYVDVQKNISNLCAITKTINDAITEKSLKIENDIITNNKCIKNVPVEYIEKIIYSTEFSPANDVYDVEGLLDFIKRFKTSYLNTWDIVFVEGDKKREDNLFNVPNLENLKIHLTRKKFDIFYNYLRMQGAREQLHNMSDTSACLIDKNQEKDLIELFKKDYSINHSPEEVKSLKLIPAKAYLNTKNRKPLLMIYLIELSDKEINEEQERVIDSFKKNNAVPIGIAFAIPKYTDEISKSTTFKINIVEQRNRRNKENIIDKYYDEEEE